MPTRARCRSRPCCSRAATSPRMVGSRSTASTARRSGALEPALRRELVEPDPGPDGRTLRGVSRVPLADFRGELRARLPDAVVSGLHGWFAVRVSNTGSAPWPGLTARARGRVLLQARWRDAAGAVALAGEPGLLARDLAPGESVEARGGSMTPRPGSYTP